MLTPKGALKHQRFVLVDMWVDTTQYVQGLTLVVVTFGNRRSVWGLGDRTASWVRFCSVGVEAVGLEIFGVSVGTDLVEGQP